MIHAIASLAFAAAQLLVLLAIGLAVVRMWRGPHAQDRILALDTVYANAVLLLLTISIRTGSLFYLEVGLIIALLGFVGSAAFAKFLLRGELIE